MFHELLLSLKNDCSISILHVQFMMQSTNSYIYVSCICDIVVKSNYINFKLIIASIVTIFNQLIDIFVRFQKLFLNCIVSRQNGYGSGYKFNYLYCWTISFSLMLLPSINQFKLMICIIIETEMSKLQIINDTNNQFPKRMCCAAIKYFNFDFGCYLHN